jgi:hypothetical protein
VTRRKLKRDVGALLARLDAAIAARSELDASITTLMAAIPREHRPRTKTLPAVSVHPSSVAALRIDWPEDVVPGVGSAGVTIQLTEMHPDGPALYSHLAATLRPAGYDVRMLTHVCVVVGSEEVPL